MGPLFSTLPHVKGSKLQVGATLLSPGSSEAEVSVCLNGAVKINLQVLEV